MNDKTTFLADEQTRVLVTMLLQQREELFGIEVLQSCAGALDAAFAFLVTKLGATEAQQVINEAVAKYFAKIERRRVQ